MCNSSDNPFDQALAVLERMQQTLAEMQQQITEARRDCVELLETCQRIDKLLEPEIAHNKSAD